MLAGVVSSPASREDSQSMRISDAIGAQDRLVCPAPSPTELSKSCWHRAWRSRLRPARVPAKNAAAAMATPNQLANAAATALSAAVLIGGSTGEPFWSTQISVTSLALTACRGLTAPVCSAPAANHRAKTAIVLPGEIWAALSSMTAAVTVRRVWACSA